jgi:hypothetical protein
MEQYKPALSYHLEAGIAAVVAILFYLYPVHRAKLFSSAPGGEEIVQKQTILIRDGISSVNKSNAKYL